VKESRGRNIFGMNTTGTKRLGRRERNRYIINLTLLRFPQKCQLSLLLSPGNNYVVVDNITMHSKSFLV
jgi:hypothetical protein